MKAEVISPGPIGVLLENPVVRAALRRIPGMLAVWVGFAAVVGAQIAPGAGPIALAAGVIAGLIVLTPLGLFLALVGGNWRASLAGGVLGLTAIPALGQYLPLPSGVALAPLGVIMGGIVGATVVMAFYTLPRLLLSAARGRAASPGRVEEPVAA